MADTQKVIIAEIDIKVDGVLERQAAILAEQKKLKDQQKEYTDAVKKGSEVTKEQTDTYVKNQANLKNLGSEYSQNTRLLQAQAKTEAAAVGSREQLNAQLTQASIKWAKLSESERENTETGKQLSRQKLELSTRIQEMDRATGSGATSVGLYDAAIERSSHKLGIFTKIQDTAGKSSKLVAENISKVKGAGDYAAQGIDMVKSGFNQLIKNPIIAVLSALVAVFMLVKNAIGSSSKASNTLKEAMAPLKTVMAALQNVMVFLVQIFLDIFKAMTSLIEPITKLIGLNDKYSKSVQDAAKVEKERQQIVGDTRKMLVEEAKGNLEIAKLRDKVTEKDKYTREERGKFLQEAIKIEEKMMGDKKKLAERELSNLEAQLKVKDELNGEDKDKLAAAKKKLIDVETDYYTSIRRMKTQVATFNKQEDEEIQKQKEDAIKKEEEQRQKANEKYKNDLNYKIEILKLKNKTLIKEGIVITEDLLQNELSRIKMIFDSEMKANEDLKKRGLISEQEYNKQKIELAEQNQKNILEVGNKRIEQIQKDLDVEIREYLLSNESKLNGAKTLTADLIAQETLRLDELRKFELSKLLLSSDSEQEIAIKRKEINAQTDKEISDLNAQFTEQENAKKIEAQTIQAQAEFDLQQLQIQNEFDAERAALDVSYQNQIAAAVKVGADTTALTAIYEKAKTDIAKKENQARLNVLSNLAGNLAQLFGKETAMGKAAASAQVAIQTYQGSMAAWSAAQVFPAPFNAIVGGASVAATVALGSKSISDIWAVKTGLPEGGGGNQPSVNVNTGGGGNGAPPIAPNFDGGFANSSINGSSGQIQPISQPVLVVDEVTFKQNHISNMNKVTTL